MPPRRLAAQALAHVKKTSLLGLAVNPKNESRSPSRLTASASPPARSPIISRRASGSGNGLNGSPLWIAAVASPGLIAEKHDGSPAAARLAPRLVNRPAIRVAAAGSFTTGARARMSSSRSWRASIGISLSRLSRQRKPNRSIARSFAALPAIAFRAQARRQAPTSAAGGFAASAAVSQVANGPCGGSSTAISSSSAGASDSSLGNSACPSAAIVIDRPEGCGTAWRPSAAKAGCGSAPCTQLWPSLLTSNRCTPPHCRSRSQTVSPTNMKGRAASGSADSIALSPGGVRPSCIVPGAFELARNRSTDCGVPAASVSTRPVPGDTPSSRTVISRRPDAGGTGRTAQAGCLVSTAVSVAMASS